MLDKLLKIATSEIGNTGSKYRTWFYGSEQKGVPWCAVFVSYIFNKAGVPMYKTDGAGCFARNGQYGTWFESEYTDKNTTPKVGDIVTFVNNKAGRYTSQDKFYSDHVGIVVEVTDDKITTIEGNVNGSNDTSKVTARVYNRKDGYINGYYRPTAFNKLTDNTQLLCEKGDKNNYVYAVKTLALIAYEMGLVSVKVNNDNIYGNGTEKAINELQKKTLSEVDGIVGSETLTNINTLILTKIKTDKKKVAELF